MTELTEEEALEAVKQAEKLLSEAQWAMKRLPICQEDRDAHRKACRDALFALRDGDPDTAQSVLTEIVEGK